MIIMVLEFEKTTEYKALSLKQQNQSFRRRK